MRRTLRPAASASTPTLLAANLIAMAAVALLVVGLSAAPAGADEGAPAADAGHPAMVAVIETQLAAFRAGDTAAAFAQAAPAIKAKFQSPAGFMRMVRQGYSPLLAPTAKRFLPADSVREGAAIQRMAFVGPDGTGWMAHYKMSRQPDGTWKIAGCRLEKLPGGAV